MMMDDLQKAREAARAKARQYFESLTKEQLVQALVDVGFVVIEDDRERSANYSVSFTIDVEPSPLPKYPATLSLSA